MNEQARTAAVSGLSVLSLACLVAASVAAQTPAPAPAPTKPSYALPAPDSKDALEVVRTGLTVDRRMSTESAKTYGAPSAAIAVVDLTGRLVAFARSDDASMISVELAIEKARTAVLHRAKTSDLDKLLQGDKGGLRVLKIEGTPIEGGLALVTKGKDGKVIGGIGVAGAPEKINEKIAAEAANAAASFSAMP